MEASRGRAPDGSGESETVELSEPQQLSGPPEEVREPTRPDLDERDRQVARPRKPMGPPLREPSERSREVTEEFEQERVETPPVDPAGP